MFVVLFDPYLFIYLFFLAVKIVALVLTFKHILKTAGPYDSI